MQSGVEIRRRLIAAQQMNGLIISSFYKNEKNNKITFARMLNRSYPASGGAGIKK
jgi:hypothetical protein